MAGITSSGRMREPDEFDYSVSHREPPVPSVGYSTTQARRPPRVGEDPGRPDDEASLHTEGRRRGSFSFLRRSSSHNRDNHLPADENAPPLPATRIAQAHLQAAAGIPQESSHGSGNSHSRGFSSSSNRGKNSASEGKSNMLSRKVSKQRQAEQERMAREAAAQQTPRQPPRLPSHNPLPNIGQFGGEDARPDSFAIFNNQYSTASSQQQPAPHTANFSRPGNVTMPSSNLHSSSPSYAIRSGNAFAQQAAAANSSSPALDSRSTNGEYVVDPLAHAESMTHRGRYSYASSSAPVNVSSPRRVRRRKDPTPFNILVIGAKNSGKTSIISFLRHSLALPSNKQPYGHDAAGDSQVNHSKSSFTSHYLETEMEGERVGLTLWDSAGLEKHIIDLQLREMAAFVESKFEETFVEEQKVQRTPGVKDTHIHCVLLVLDPIRLDSTAAQKTGASMPNAGGLDDEMDLQVIRALWGKTTVIPVIAKADTLTIGHMGFLKRAVWDSLKGAKLDPLEALDLEGDESEYEDALDEEDEESEQDGVGNNLEEEGEEGGDGPVPKPKRNGHNRQTSLAATVSSANGDEPPYIPMSILSPDLYDLPPYVKVSRTSKIGRRFPWGLADPYDPEHCDFVRLRDSIFSEWRGDLRDLARTKWYENWRTSRLKNLPGSKQRVKGGVTPVAAVPREGRTSPHSPRTFSGGNTAVAGAGAQAIPRSVSGSTAATGGIGMAVGSPTDHTNGGGLSKAERMMGMSSSDAQSVASRGGQYRGVETYQ